MKWNLSSGLYWARPGTYVTLDGPSRDYLATRYSTSAPTDGEGYLRLLDSLGRQLRGASSAITSFPELSYAAWIAGRSTEVPHSMAGLVHWAGRFAESIDLDEVENDFKRHAAAAGPAGARSVACRRPRMAGYLQGGAEGDQHLDFLFKDTLNHAVADNPDRDGRSVRAGVV